MKSKMSKLIALVLFIPFILSMMLTTAIAAPHGSVPADAIIIDSIEDLEAAITGQQDGQTWLIKEGNYDLSPNSVLIAGSQTGWYFPILADNLTIIGQGNPIVYSSVEVPNGVWSTQTLIAVFGNNCTLSGLTIEPKLEVNKTIEVIGDINFTIRDCNIIPNPKSPEDGGALYFNGNGKDGTNVIRVEDNLFDYSLIAFDGFSAGSIRITGNTFLHIIDGAYAIGNAYWGSVDRITAQYSDVFINGNNFCDIQPGQCIIKARLNQTFLLSANNKVNSAKVKPKNFGQYVVFGNTSGGRYQDCANAKVYFGDTLYTLK